MSAGLDPVRLIELARSLAGDRASTHWDGCEAYHSACLMQRLADALETVTRERDELRAEVEHLQSDIQLMAALTHRVARHPVQQERQDLLDRITAALGRDPA